MRFAFSEGFVREALECTDTFAQQEGPHDDRKKESDGEDGVDEGGRVPVEYRSGKVDDEVREGHKQERAGKGLFARDDDTVEPVHSCNR